MRPQRGPGQLSWDGQKAEIGFGPSSRGPYMAYTIYLGGPKSTALLSCYVSAPGRQETGNSKTYFLWLTGTVVIPQSVGVCSGAPKGFSFVPYPVSVIPSGLVSNRSWINYMEGLSGERPRSGRDPPIFTSPLVTRPFSADSLPPLIPTLKYSPSGTLCTPV
jgi:hypothetical protein